MRSRRFGPSPRRLSHSVVVYAGVCSTFPYALFYSLYAQEVRILAVAHQRRRPFYWEDRR